MADSRPLFARSLVIQPPRRLKLHWSTAFESQNPCHTCPHAVEFPIRKNGKVKCEVALAKGKAEHDKRDTIKDREGKREVERAMKTHRQ